MSNSNLLVVNTIIEGWRQLVEEAFYKRFGLYIEWETLNE
jgi:hypothetical protein